MKLDTLFDQMEEAGIGRPKSAADLHSYAAWAMISRAVLQGKSEKTVLGKIPWAAKAMGINRRRHDAGIAVMERETYLRNLGRGPRKGRDIVTELAFGYDSEAGE